MRGAIAQGHLHFGAAIDNARRISVVSVHVQIGLFGQSTIALFDVDQRYVRIVVDFRNLHPHGEDRAPIQRNHVLCRVIIVGYVFG